MTCPQIAALLARELVMIAGIKQATEEGKVAEFFPRKAPACSMKRVKAAIKDYNSNPVFNVGSKEQSLKYPKGEENPQSHEQETG